MKIINKTYNINNKLNKKIILISDIHYKNKKDINILNKVLYNIKKINPDYICIPGDIIDKSSIKDESDFIEWLIKLSNICKVIISIGNHEFYINKYKKIYGLNKKLFNKISKLNNIYLLDNKNVVIDNINFIGITIPMEYYQKKYINNFDKHLKKLKTYKEKYNILLCHSPINICNEKLDNFNLVLCGHMHGGVVLKLFRKLFKNNGLISPNKKIFPKNVYGNLKKDNTNIVITSGIKVIPYRFINKLFNPEIVEITI